MKETIQIRLLSPGASKVPYEKSVNVLYVVCKSPVEWLTRASADNVESMIIQEANHRLCRLFGGLALTAKTNLKKNFEIILINQKFGAVPVEFDRAITSLVDLEPPCTAGGS